MIFSEIIFIREERLDVTTTGWCLTSTLPFLSITLLLSFPKTISSLKSDLTSRQQGAAKLLRCHFCQLLYFYLFENNFIREERLNVTTTGCCQTSTLPFLAMIFSENFFIREERIDVTTTGCCQTSTLSFLAMSFSENNFIREERLAVTTTGWCQASTLPLLSITLLLSFPKTISSVKSDLTSRQLGAAKILRCHF